MNPADLGLFRCYGPPALLADGSVVASLSTPEVDADRYREVLHRVREDAPIARLTEGPRDSGPVASPDGRTVVFLRGGESGPRQLYAMPTDGGEPRPLARHPLGASAVTFSPDGTRIAYLAAVPEPGRYGTAEAAGDGAADGHTVVGPTDGSDTAPAAEAEAPRRIDRLWYRSDGKGFIGDKLEQVFVQRIVGDDGALVDDPRATRLTGEPCPIGRPVFTPDGEAVLYTRPVAPDAIRSEIALLAVGTERPDRGETLIETAGDAVLPVAHEDRILFYGTEFADDDFAGHTIGLWSAPLAGGPATRLTDPHTVHIDPGSGEPIPVADGVLVPVADRGAVRLLRVPTGTDHTALDDLDPVIDGQLVVRSFTHREGTVAAVVADPGRAGDVMVVRPDAPDRTPRSLTDVSEPLRAAGLGEVVELAGTAPDGYPVHGWLVLPPVDRHAGPHPVLLSVHGGPHAAYTWAVFDEAQMYASRGYAVVLPNPRGSAGYGLGHGRSIVGRLGTVDADDVLAVLDTALEHPRFGEDLDGAHVGVMGGSYGGFMTSWLASHAPERFVAGISERAVNAWDSFIGTSDIGYFFGAGYVGTDRDAQWAASPLAHADRIAIPLLIIHSEQDWRCPLEQAQRLFVALKRRGHDTEMVLFPGEGHELSRSGRPRHRRQRFEAILDWWARHLPVG